MHYAFRFTWLPAAAVAALFLLMPHAAHAATVTIVIKDMKFTPQSASAQPGDTIRWVNQDSVPHTVTQDSGAFGSGTIAPGQAYSIQVNVPMTHAYHCDFHPQMTGTLIVNSASATTNTNTNTTTNTNATTGSNSSAQQLAAQAQALLDRVSQLQSQLGASSGSGSTVSSANCPLIGRVLKRGSSGDDVSRLQKFLAVDPSIYPEAQTTGYYGALTEAAVKRWQAKYNIVSSGTAESTGFGVVGPRTAAAISLQCSSISGGSSGSGGGTVIGNNITSPAVGGFIEVSPVQGNAPLSVSVKATVNTVLSCAAVRYTLEWGDGTIPQVIDVPAGDCGQLVRTYTHAYFYGGTYIVRLASGGHETTATVLVSGQSAPTASNLPAQTFSASPTSGAAPLTVTFSGTVTGANAGWCQANCTDVLDFGDGTTGSVPLPATTNGVSQYSLQHTYANGGTFTATHYQGQAGSGKPTVGNPIAITVSGASATDLGPLQISSNLNNNPLSVRATFDMTCGTSASVNWGDTNRDVVTVDCAQSGVATKSVRTFDQTYAAAGSYTITLTRGSKTDTSAIVISL